MNRHRIQGLVFLGSLLALAAVLHLELYFPLAPEIDTAYAATFSWDNWHLLRNGLSEESVLTLLGQPLVRNDVLGCWEYSRDGKAWFGDFAWRDVEVCFVRGRVNETFAYWSYN